MQSDNDDYTDTPVASTMRLIWMIFRSYQNILVKNIQCTPNASDGSLHWVIPFELGRKKEPFG